ncbi:MAG TPA: ABC transporter permease [Solirubrobacterales bacterium]|nr:ABC transporter permease [Solirubrobacterales bacterium]
MSAKGVSVDGGRGEPADVALAESPDRAAQRYGSVAKRFAAQYSAVVALVLTVIIFGALRPETFLTTDNLKTILSSQAVLLIVTLGLTLALTVGEFDLSIGATVGLTGVVVGWLNVTHAVPIGIVIVAALATGLLIGCINAFLIVRLGITSLVATLGTSTVLAGISLGISNSIVVTGIDQGFTDLVSNGPFDLPLSVYFAFALAIALWYLYEHTPLGRYLNLVGTGREVARLSGLPVDRYRVLALVGTSVIAATAGLVLTGTLGSSDPTVGGTFLLPAFAGAFLGATTIRPGRFNAWGTVIALYFLVTGITGLNLLGITGWVEQVFYGGALIVSVTIARLTSEPTS